MQKGLKNILGTVLINSYVAINLTSVAEADEAY